MKVKTLMDIGWRDESCDAEATVENAAAEVEAYLQEEGKAGEITFRVIDPCGPGGGAVVAELAGEREALVELVTEYVRSSAWQLKADGSGYEPAPLDEQEVAEWVEGFQPVA